MNSKQRINNVQELLIIDSSVQEKEVILVKYNVIFLRKSFC